MQKPIFLTPAATLLMGLLLALPNLAQAQIYRSVDAQGKVVFSDQPPPASANKVTAIRPGKGEATGSAGSGGLPYELSQVASRYPVTLYTSKDCAPCGNGRSFLAGRGIPFSEKTVSTQEDIEALKRLSSEASMPFLTIGGQQLKGFSSTEWGQFLDAAGYPANSQLPPSYRQAEASPLVAAQRPTVAAPAAPAPRAEAAAPSAAEPAPANPAGIRF